MQSKEMSMKKAQDQESTSFLQLTSNLICCMCHFTDVSEDRWKAMSIKNHMEKSVLVRIVFIYPGFEQTPLHGCSTAATWICWHFLKNATLPTLVYTGLLQVLLQSTSDTLATGQSQKIITKKTQSPKKPHQQD